ncbi:MAG: shikimate dehydrogenase, partial [Acetobacteraceae bacterium]|nr:shikimate dehydrogenase [Acetobacteraceae bacterium]
QAVGAFRLFTGLEPDAERMLRHFREMVGAPSPVAP